MRILVAEDERVLANTIATALRAACTAEVDVAFDGASAHRFALEREYAVLVRGGTDGVPAEETA